MKCPICSEDMPEEMQRFLNYASYPDDGNPAHWQHCYECSHSQGRMVCLHCWVKYRAVGMSPIHKLIVDLNS